MNSRRSASSDQADDRIRELLAVADQDAFEPCESLLDRIQCSLSDTIDSHEMSDGHETFLNQPMVSSDSKTVELQGGRSTFGRRRLWTAACVVVACLAVSVMTFLRSPEVLGDVFSALRSQPRVHIRCQDVHGNDLEAWISAERYSVKRAESSFVLNRTKNFVDTYYPEKQRIVRSVPTFMHEPPAFNSLLELMQSLPGTMDEVGGMAIVSMKTEPGKNDAAETLRHSIELAAPPSHLNGTITMSLDVVAEAKTNLPSACTVRIRQSGGNDPVERTVNLVFDYPNEEPQAILDLGASKEAKLVDTTNPESDPLYAKVQSALEHGRRGLKMYRALVGTDPKAPQYVVWRSGLKWKIDYLGNFRGERIAGDPGLTPPAIDLSGWKDVFVGEGQTLNVFDGVDRWDRNEEQLVKAVLPPFFPMQLRDSEWIGSMTLERLAYPFLGVEDGFVMSMTEESPGGLVLVEYSAVVKVDNLVHRTRRYWLNPEYGYAVVKSEYTDAAGSEEAFQATLGVRRHMVHLNSGYEQSPDGVWYPTSIRDVGKQFFRTPENPVLNDDWMYYQVDFAASVPKEIFATP